MRWLIELLQRMIIGTEIGITCYVWIGVSCYSSVKVTLPIAAEISLMGAMIGGATFIFRIPRINYYFAFLNSLSYCFSCELDFFATDL